MAIKKQIVNDPNSEYEIEISHVIPDNEIKIHIVSEECWCTPSLRYVNPNTNNEIWIHHWQQ